MTGREKLEAALASDGTPEIPVVICYESIFIRDHWSQLTDRPWWYRNEPDIDRQVAWRRDAIERTGQDWYALPDGHSRADRERIGIEETDGRAFRVDRQTGRKTEIFPPIVSGWTAPGLQHSVHPDYLPATAEELDERIPLPRPVDPDSLRAEGRFDLADRMAAEFRSHFPIAAISSPFWGCYALWGFEGTMATVADRPDLVEHACDRVLQQRLPAVREAAARGVRGIWIEECLTDMINPEAFRRLNLPFLRSLVDEIRSCGMLSVYYYCGNPAGKWDMLLDAGSDAIGLEESKKDFEIDIEEVVSKVDGRCAVLGNLDAIGVLQNGTEDQLQSEIERQIRAGRKNRSRFIMGLGSPVTPETPVRRVRQYCEIARDLGRSL